MEIQISHAYHNHFEWYKLQCIQHGKNYKKHSIILRKEELETLLEFEANGESVMFWVMQLETDEDLGWCWCILEAL